MEQDLVKEFLGVSEEEAKAWLLFVEMLRAFRDAEAGVSSRREADEARRRFERFLERNNLRMLGEEEGLASDELAIATATEAEQAGIRKINTLDILLLVDHESVCEAFVAEDVRSAALVESVVDFFSSPEVPEWLKERLVERDAERAERLLKAVLSEIPDEVCSHFMLVTKYEREGRFADAEAEYKRFLSVREDAVVWANYGWFLERRERYEEALNAFERSISLLHAERTGVAGVGVAGGAGVAGVGGGVGSVGGSEVEGVGGVGGGEEEYLLAELEKSVSRVSRMKELRGEYAQKAREYQRAVWLINEVREFATKRLSGEIERAKAEFMRNEGLEELSEEDALDFMNWFLFSRRLPDGKTPALLYAEEKGLDEELKKKLEALGSPVSGVFEVLSYEPARFSMQVRNLLTEEEYELMADMDAEVSAGQTFAGSIYPWGEFFLSGGALRMHSPEFSDEIKSVVSSFKGSEVGGGSAGSAAVEELRREREEAHNAFVSFFGSWEVVFATKSECEEAINRFLEWFLFERPTAVEGKTIAELYREAYDEELERERFKIPPSFEHAQNIGVLSDAEAGIFLVQDYGLLKRAFERGAAPVSSSDFTRLKEVLLEIEPFALRKLVQMHGRNAVNVINEVFNASLREDASVDEIEAFLAERAEREAASRSARSSS